MEKKLCTSYRWSSYDVKLTVDRKLTNTGDRKHFPHPKRPCYRASYEIAKPCTEYQFIFHISYNLAAGQLVKWVHVLWFKLNIKFKKKNRSEAHQGEMFSWDEIYLYTGPLLYKLL